MNATGESVRHFEIASQLPRDSAIDFSTKRSGASGFFLIQAWLGKLPSLLVNGQFQITTRFLGTARLGTQ